MSKNVAMFVDVANMYYAARGQDVDVDYVALLKHATKGRDLIRAYAYTGLDPENENQRKFIDFLAKNGYKPVVKDIRKFGDGRMKANLDIELVVDLFRLADRMDIAVIVSGDGDFAPAIRALQDKGVRAEVISFKPNTSSDLIAVADEFMDIMKIASISRKEARAGREAAVPTPEMPAKEVAPEFGFREASPTVAAAALAAIKGGGATDAPRRGRAAASTRRVRAAAAPSEPAAGEPIQVVTTEGDAESRRRRRRRGGRGRGRGRRDEEVTPAIATGDEEIGWEEFDDLSQLDGGIPDDREYTFEEADPATLAELGLPRDEVATADAMPAGEVAADETKTKPRRRSPRAGKAAAAATADEPKARRSPRAAKPKAEAEGAESPNARPRATRAAKPRGEDEGAGVAAKPRRRSTRATGDGATTGDGADDAAATGEPQGIWGRFRQARKPRGSAG